MNLSAFVKLNKTLVLATIALFIVVCIQFVSPVISNPPVTGDFKGPEEVKSIFKRACYDCHSNETKLSWYDRLAPVSWLVSADVKEARKRFNLSNWDSIPKPLQEVQLWEMVNMIDQGKMPLKSYTTLHHTARLQPGDLEVLKNYVRTLPGTRAIDTSKILHSVQQMETSSAVVPVSPTGISYFSDYKNWKVISATNKYDATAIKVIYGNDIAVKAVQEGHTHPWPNGTKLAKVIWTERAADKDGYVRPANFNNVQFMIKDDQKYKETEGWGFAKFIGLDLKPYGKTAAFATTCINCHRLATNNGFVFDFPTKPKTAVH